MTQYHKTLPIALGEKSITLTHNAFQLLSVLKAIMKRPEGCISGAQGFASQVKGHSHDASFMLIVAEGNSKKWPSVGRACQSNRLYQDGCKLLLDRKNFCDILYKKKCLEKNSKSKGTLLH